MEKKFNIIALIALIVSAVCLIITWNNLNHVSENLKKTISFSLHQSQDHDNE